jgi:C1A family cysteine protease
MGTISLDSGASLRTTLDGMKKWGACSESMWPYATSKFADQPPIQCYAEGAKCVVTRYARVPQTLTDIKTSVSSGFPVIYGFRVYESFDWIGPSGKMPIPDKVKEKIGGGHAVSIVGYDDSMTFGDTPALGGFIVRNSWGVLWGNLGYFYVPYSVILDSSICSDFWVIQETANPPNVIVPPAGCCDGGCQCSLM